MRFNKLLMFNLQLVVLFCYYVYIRNLWGIMSDVNKAYQMAMRGEIVSTVSPLAMDEDIGCKKCGHIFTLSEALYEEPHELYPAVIKHGFQCPKCKNINFAYVKTPKLMSLEKRITKADTPLKQKARIKYQREFARVQKNFGMV